MSRHESAPFRSGRRGGARAACLLVDDEPGFARTLAKRMRLRGYECVVADDGTSALRLLAEGPFLGVLLDLRLPDIPGAEVLRRVKAREPDLPVIIMTAHGTDDDERECLEAGASAFLSKPVDIDEIVHLLAQAGGAPR